MERNSKSKHPCILLSETEADLPEQFAPKLSATDGKELSKLALPAPPTLDGMAAASGKLYLSTQDGTLRCFGKE